MSQRSDDSWLRVTYLVRAAASEIAARAEALMLEQTVELPRTVAARDPWVAAHMLGRVERIDAVGDGTHRVTIAQPLATTAADPAQLLNVLYGNSSLQPDVVLADVDLPAAAFDWLPGPRVGIGGAAGARRRRGPAAAGDRAQADGASSGAARGALRHGRSRGDRSRQGRPRPRRPSVLPLRGAGRGLSPRGGRRGPRHRPARRCTSPT